MSGIADSAGMEAAASLQKQPKTISSGRSLQDWLRWGYSGAGNAAACGSGLCPASHGRASVFPGSALSAWAVAEAGDAAELAWWSAGRVGPVRKQIRQTA